MTKPAFSSWCLFIAALFIVAISPKQVLAAETEHSGVKAFLRGYVGSRDDGKSTQYFSASLDLNDDGVAEVLVYLTNDGWCGSGGCTTLILARNGSSYRIIAKISLTRPPIRVMSSKSNGWHDIAVRVQGGGIVRGYEAELQFDGKTYPGNPSVLPARRISSGRAGKVVVSPDNKGKPLF